MAQERLNRCCSSRLSAARERLGQSFGEVTELGTVTVPVVEAKTRMLHFCRLAVLRRR